MSTLELISHFWPQTPTGPISVNPLEIPDVGRDDLAQLFGQLGFKNGVEVGTEYGEYAETLCKSNPHLQLDCVDPYLAYKDYRDHTSQAKLNGIYEQATQRLAPYHVSMIRVTSEAASCAYRDESLDFVYLDGNHALPYVIADLHAWARKIRKGGIVAGHDFKRRNNRRRYQCHVVEALYAYTQCYMIEPWYVLGRKAVVEGETRDAIRSWMFVKG